jgi:hypothetical protein
MIRARNPRYDPGMGVPVDPRSPANRGRGWTPDPKSGVDTRSRPRQIGDRGWGWKRASQGKRPYSVPAMPVPDGMMTLVHLQLNFRNSGVCARHSKAGDKDSGRLGRRSPRLMSLVGCTINLNLKVTHWGLSNLPLSTLNGTQLYPRFWQIGDWDGGGPPIAGKSGVGVGVDRRSPANRARGWGWGSGVPCPGQDQQQVPIATGAHANINPGESPTVTVTRKKRDHRDPRTSGRCLGRTWRAVGGT